MKNLVKCLAKINSRPFWYLFTLVSGNAGNKSTSFVSRPSRPASDPRSYLTCQTVSIFLLSIMDQKLLYAFRGWIAFIAFMDMGTAIRCFIEKRSILGEHSFTKIDNLLMQQDDSTLPRILGAYSVLKALALIHCTLYIHYKPVVSMGICSLVLTLLVYVSEALYFQSTTLNFYVIFPCVLNVLTLLGLVFLPRRLLESEPVTMDENTELLRLAGGMRRRRAPKVKDN